MASPAIAAAGNLIRCRVCENATQQRSDGMRALKNCCDACFEPEKKRIVANMRDARASSVGAGGGAGGPKPTIPQERIAKAGLKASLGVAVSVPSALKVNNSVPNIPVNMLTICWLGDNVGANSMCVRALCAHLFEPLITMQLSNV